MYIYEAIKSTTPQTPYITRKSWCYLTDRPCPAAVKILPTNSPDGCVVKSVSADKSRRGWQPSADDLTASDWVLVK